MFRSCLTPTGGGQDVFVHISAFPDDARRPVEGDAVRYELRRGFARIGRLAGRTRADDPVTVGQTSKKPD
ncbi:MAG: cold shock domain-containing protein [Wenzhouxiangellaceae bacterium]